jgi:pilus assembly protein Flp/PilA
MNKLINAFNASLTTFAKEQEGAQVVEYALIIAVVSIGLVLALSSGTTNLKTSFAALITRVTGCLTAGGTCS